VPNNKFKIAIIGSGYMASQHAKAITDSAECKLIGIHSTNPLTSRDLSKRYSIPHVEQSIYDLYNNCKPDIVIIAVSELSSLEVCCEAFNYPWKIILEKPVGYNLEQANIIYERSRLKKSEVYVGLNRRQYSTTKWVLSECNSSDEIRRVHIQDQENIINAISSGTPTIIAQHYMYANSIHLIDYLNVFCRGQLVSVDNVIKWNPDKPGLVLSVLKFSSGDIGIYEAYWNSPAPWSVSISTQSSRWEMRPLEKASKLTLNSRVPEEFVVHNWDLLFKPGIRSQIEELVKLAKNQSHSLTTLAEAMKSIYLINQIYEI
jgi:predicted dehydrogenase